MSTFLTAEWRNLIMANYEIDPALLKKYLPAKTELDTFNGIHYVSLVGFLFQNTKVKGIPFPFHRTFEEINLRFYVKYNECGEWKRGVVFIKEIVPKRIIAMIANLFYNENYQALKTKHQWSYSPKDISVEYQWRHKGDWNWIKAVGGSEKCKIESGSEAEFITEHYWGYARVNDNKSVEYEVVHPKWSIQKVRDYDIQCNFQSLYGEEFKFLNNLKPLSVFITEGSEISVIAGKKI